MDSYLHRQRVQCKAFIIKQKHEKCYILRYSNYVCLFVCLNGCLPGGRKVGIPSLEILPYPQDELILTYTVSTSSARSL